MSRPNIFTEKNKQESLDSLSKKLDSYKERFKALNDSLEELNEGTPEAEAFDEKVLKLQEEFNVFMEAVIEQVKLPNDKQLDGKILTKAGYQEWLKSKTEKSPREVLLVEMHRLNSDIQEKLVSIVVEEGSLLGSDSDSCHDDNTDGDDEPRPGSGQFHGGKWH